MKARAWSVTLAVGGLAVLVAVLLVTLRPRAGRPRDAAAGQGRESLGGGASSGEAGRAALKDGRFAAAFASFARPGSNGPGADELAALGSALLARDRLALGWAAMEAARRVDRNQGPANRALVELERSLNQSNGPERLRREQAAEEVEHLRAIRGGPALGLVALGLAGHVDRPGRERDFLDRLLIRERSELRGIDGPAAAVKLVSRLLMETGRPAEASDLLRPYVEGRGSGSGGSASADGEAAWLLSRAALQLGRADEADAMLERAGGFGRDGTSPEPAPFVGSRKCAECHPSAYRAAQGASPHARTIAHGAGLKDVPLPDRPITDSADPHLHHRFTRTAADRIEMESRDDGGRVVRAVVEYAMGSGEHGFTMVARDEPTGTPRQLRVSYYAGDRSWHGTKGMDKPPRDPPEFIGEKLSEAAMRQCLHCHTTWFRNARPEPSIPAGPEALDRGIGCERCHGPGLDHVLAAETGFAEPAIAATGDSPPARLLKSCQECHGSNGLVEPGDPEFTRFQGTTLKYSRCFTGSRGAIHCATCHDPHRGLETVAARYEEKCLRCHAATPGPAAVSAGQPHQAACPVNPSTGCIGCHMPKIQDQRFQSRFTDHHIRVHRGNARDGGKAAGGERR